MGKKAAEELRPADPETEEKKRLRSLAVSRRLLRRSPARPSNYLEPSKSVLKLDGRDIVKRGQRRSRYLFSFPGLLAPLSGGKIGELADLATKNPKLYVEFPQGRMKLFGTHVYPKNKYLTLQLTKSSKGVMCEDCFESMIVFSDAWWIGLKEENPEEKQLEFPVNFKMGEHPGVDFEGGAGASPEGISGGNQPGNEHKGPLSPKTELEDDSQDDSYPLAEKNTSNVMEATPVRQSGRTAGKTQNYAELSSGDDSIANNDEVPELMDEKMEDSKSAAISHIDSTSTMVDTTKSAGKCKESSSSSKKSAGSNKKGSMVQATLSTLFGKVAEKKSKRKADDSPGPKGSGRKRLQLNPDQTADQTKVKELKKVPVSRRKKTGTGTGTLQEHSQDDYIEDFSSESQDLNDSDEEWVA